MLLMVDINLLTKKHSHATCTMDTRCARKPLNFWFGVGVNSRLQSINNHHLEEGLVETVHKNTEHLPHHAITCSFDDVAHIVRYFQDYADQIAILLPGCIPGYKRDDMKLLPCRKSKRVSCIPNYTVMDT